MKRLLTGLSALLSAAALQAQPIDLHWIGQAPEAEIGQSWGVPFSRGQIKPNQQFVLTDGSGKQLPLQSWVMATHGDGSAKWIGFAASIAPSQAEGLRLTPVKKAPVCEGLQVSEQPGRIVVDNGVQQIAFATSGSELIPSITVNGTEVARNGHLVCRLEDRSRASEDIISYKKFRSEIEQVTLERRGPVEAVVKVEGRHRALDGSRSWLPFTVRFYIFDRVPAVKMVHSIIYDGDMSRDFISGLGVEFSLPLREEMQNRHVRFAGENGGLWGEPVKPAVGRRRLNYQNRNDLIEAQFRGERMPDKAQVDEAGQKLLTDWADWSDFRLTQLTPDAFSIRKRTNDQSTWIGTAGGGRAEGYVQAGDLQGGLGVSLKNFWQSYPTELEVLDMVSDQATLTVWMWSPRGEAMDLRHYDIKGHDLNSAYEDYQEGMSTPYGIARTSELTLVPYSQMPTREQTVKTAQTAQEVCQLMATPQYLHDAGAFGVWSLPDPDGNDTKQWIERQIDGYIDFYKQAIETQKWYGFWNYGDVMHSYTQGRHAWNYDIGGNAWANTELSPDLWLWYAFIRSGRADIFRMATAMTRHTSEVDMYHIGEMAGLGSRHNVSHWGCGAKEARIGQAWWKRFYYYLTTDDRMGDLMHDAVDADYTTLKWDPLRIAKPRSQYPTAQPTRLRWGPDWIAFVGNWYTEWERTGNKKYLDKIITGMESIAAMPNGLFTGKGPFGYDPETGKLTYEGDPEWIDHTNHLANLMGGVEVMMEVFDGVGNKKFNDTYLQYAKYYALPQDDPLRDKPENAKYKDWWGHWNTSRMGAFAGERLGEEYLKEVAWNLFLQRVIGPDGQPRDLVNPKQVEGTDALAPFLESPSVGTNGAAQWNLEAIELMELAGDKVPSLKDLKPAPPMPRR